MSDRSVCWRCTAVRATSEETEPIMQPGGDLLGGEDADSGGSQLNGEGHAVEPVTDLGDGRRAPPP